MSNDISVNIETWEEDGEFTYHVLFSRGEEEPQVLATGSNASIKEVRMAVTDAVSEVLR